ncbi:MAG TPA: LytR C-terminal domain-containing protein [Jatrophihabitans sp.]|jgi:hypothetical protein
MTAPERRRPLPALAFIGVLCLLTGIVWFRVIHRSDGPSKAAASKCPATISKKTAQPAKASVVPRPTKVSVLVLNSTSKNGIATSTQKALTKQGFHVTDAKNDGAAYGGHGVIKGVAEIRYGPRALPAATLVHLYLPKASMHETNASSRLVTVSLGAGYKTIAPEKAVHKAMRAAHLRFGTTKPVATKSPSC